MSRTAADSRLAGLSPESIRVAVVASNSTTCVFSREAMPDQNAVRRGARPSTLTPDALCHLCATDSETLLYEGALSVATAVVPVPSDDPKLISSTCLVLSSEFNHTVPPTKIRYGVLLILQYAGEESSPSVSTALAHWGAYSRGLRGLLYRMVDAVAASLENLAATNGQQSAIDAKNVQKYMRDHAGLTETFGDIVSSIWSSVGQEGYGLVSRAYPMLAAVNSATTAAALSAFNSRLRNYAAGVSSRRLSATSLVGGDASTPVGTPMKQRRTEDEAPPEGGEFARAAALPPTSLPPLPPAAPFSAPSTPAPRRPHVSSDAEALAHNACVENDRVDALVTIYSKSAELLAQIVSSCIGLSHPDSWISPFTFGVSDKFAALHVDDLPPNCACINSASGSQPSGSLTELPIVASSPNWRTEFINRVSPNQSPNMEPTTLPPVSPDATRAAVPTRIVICTTDEELGRATLIACATYFRPDASASELHRMLWNPASVLKTDDSDADDSDGDRPDQSTSRYVSSPAVYPNFALRVKRFDGCLNPILWLEQPSLTTAEEEALLNAGSYSRLLVIKASVVKGGQNLASYCTVVFAKPAAREKAAIGIVPKAARSAGVTVDCRFPLSSCVAVRHRLELLFGAPLPDTLIANATVNPARRASSTLVPSATANASATSRPRSGTGSHNTVAAAAPSVKVDVTTAAAFQDLLGSIDVLRFILPQRAKAMRETLASFSKNVPSHQLCGGEPPSRGPPSSTAANLPPTWGSRDSTFVSASAPISNDLIAAAHILGDNVLLLQPGASTAAPAARGQGASQAAAPNTSPSSKAGGKASASSHTRSHSFDATKLPATARPASEAASSDAVPVAAPGSAVRRIVDAYSLGDAFFASVVLGDPMVYGAYMVIDDMAQRKLVAAP